MLRWRNLFQSIVDRLKVRKLNLQRNSLQKKGRVRLHPPRGRKRENDDFNQVIWIIYCCSETQRRDLAKISR